MIIADYDLRLGKLPSVCWFVTNWWCWFVTNLACACTHTQRCRYLYDAQVWEVPYARGGGNLPLVLHRGVGVAAEWAAGLGDAPAAGLDLQFRHPPHRVPRTVHAPSDRHALWVTCVTCAACATFVTCITCVTCEVERARHQKCTGREEARLTNEGRRFPTTLCFTKMRGQKKAAAFGNFWATLPTIGPFLTAEWPLLPTVGHFLALLAQKKTS